MRTLWRCIKDYVWSNGFDAGTRQERRHIVKLLQELPANYTRSKLIERINGEQK